MSGQATFLPGSLVRNRPKWALWDGVTGRVLAVTEATPAMVRVQWVNRAGLVWERADDLLPVPEQTGDNSAERSERVSERKEETTVRETPCQRLGHRFTQQRDAFGVVTIWLYCRRCGKQHKLGTVSER